MWAADLRRQFSGSLYSAVEFARMLLVRMRRTPRSALSWRRHGPSIEGISSVRCADAQAPHGVEDDNRRAPCRAQSARRRESQEARPETQILTVKPHVSSRAATELLDTLGLVAWSDQLRIHQAASDDSAQRRIEAFGIRRPAMV